MLNKGWTPHGTDNMADKYEASERSRLTESGHSSTKKKGTAFASGLSDSPAPPSPTESPRFNASVGGCPILMQTGPDIKIMAQVQRHHNYEHSLEQVEYCRQAGGREGTLLLDYLF